ncbi:RING finger domain-containing protein [Bipolaris maydis]|nr:RING finger domain-containing protein [Bipolaris maydis]
MHPPARVDVGNMRLYVPKKMHSLSQWACCDGLKKAEPEHVYSDVICQFYSMLYPEKFESTRKRNFTTYADYDTHIAHRYAPTASSSRKIEVIDLTQDSPKKAPPPKKSKRDPDAPVQEKRARIFRKKAPQSYLVVKERALTQRLTVLSRERCGTDDVPEEKVLIAGTTGNVYTVSIGLVPSCDCPHAKGGHQCKHIIYVMLRVLKAREEIAYQLALVSSELREVMRNAPPIPGTETEKQSEDGNRKPIEGECPICYDELDAKEDTVFCKTSCGNNIHKVCMQNWVAAARNNATCPYCRANWDTDALLASKVGNINTSELQRNEEGYINVASQLGLSGSRDYSTYYSGRRRHGYFYHHY